MSQLVTQEDGVKIRCYERAMPEFVDAELERLYASSYASLSQMRIYHRGAPPMTYVASQAGRPIAVLMFRIEQNQIHVLNEVILISAIEIERFVAYVFAHWRQAQAVLFRAIRTQLTSFSYIFQRINHLEDIILTLPVTEQAYLARLGKNTRRNLRRYGDRLREKFPHYVFTMMHAEAITAACFNQVIELNRLRMVEKNKHSAYDAQSSDALFRHVRQCGLVAMIVIDGRICAGAIGVRSGHNFFLKVIAHDPAFDAYSLGMLCCYQTIVSCIAQGDREFHFLWGEYHYKYSLGGEHHPLDNLIFYRSPYHFIRQATLALDIARRGIARRLHLWLKSQQRQRGKLFHLFETMKNLRIIFANLF